MIRKWDSTVIAIGDCKADQGGDLLLDLFGGVLNFNNSKNTKLQSFKLHSFPKQS